MYLECFGLKEQLLDTVNDLESTIKQILEALYIDKKQTDRELQENMASLVEQFNGKQLEFVDLLNRVADHQEREQCIRTLEESVENRDNLISRMASELKVIESSLVEATYQAEKKCRSVKQSESNRIFSEDAIKFAHLISKHHSVASSVFWQQGDAARPFPTEAHFNVSNLLLSRTQPQQAPAFIMHGQMPGKSAMFNVPGMPPGAQRMFTPSQRPVFPPNMVPPSSTGTGSPRGRPPGTGGGARMSSPSPRSFPKILQRNQSPRFPLLMPGSLVSPSGSSPILQSQQQQPGFLSPNSLQMMAQQHSQQQMMATAGKQSTPNAAADIPRVEQMSSSSSSSSSEDEASPDGR